MKKFLHVISIFFIIFLFINIFSFFKFGLTPYEYYKVKSLEKQTVNLLKNDFYINEKNIKEHWALSKEQGIGRYKVFVKLKNMKDKNEYCFKWNEDKHIVLESISNDEQEYEMSPDEYLKIYKEKTMFHDLK